MGLNVKSQLKAILATIALVAGWLLLPVIVRSLFIDIAGRRVPFWLDCVLALSPSEQIARIERIVPLAFVARREAMAAHLSSLLILAAVNLLFHCGLWYVIRGRCLQNADRLLGRLEGPGEGLPEPLAVTGWE
jgi:hypothetical protein